MTRGLLLPGVLVLASCSGQPAATPTPTATASAAGAIPATLQGRYGLTPAACAGDSDAVRGLLTIAGDGIAFGATPLTVDRVALRADRVVFDTTDASAGMTESRRYAFRRSADGRTLARVELNRPDQVYTRCPEGPS